LIQPQAVPVTSSPIYREPADLMASPFAQHCHDAWGVQLCLTPATRSTVFDDHTLYRRGYLPCAINFANRKRRSVSTTKRCLGHQMGADVAEQRVGRLAGVTLATGVGVAALPGKAKSALLPAVSTSPAFGHTVLTSAAPASSTDATEASNSPSNGSAAAQLPVHTSLCSTSASAASRTAPTMAEETFRLRTRSMAASASSKGCCQKRSRLLTN